MSSINSLKQKIEGWNKIEKYVLSQIVDYKKTKELGWLLFCINFVVNLNTS